MSNFFDLTRAIEVLHRYEFQKESVSIQRRIKDEIRPFEHLFGGHDACHRLAASADRLRNYFTHLNPAHQPEMAYERQLPNIHLGLEILVRLIILKRLFGEPQKVLDLIKNSQPIHWRLNQYRNNFETIK